MKHFRCTTARSFVPIAKSLVVLVLLDRQFFLLLTNDKSWPLKADAFQASNAISIPAHRRCTSSPPDRHSQFKPTSHFILFHSSSTPGDFDDFQSTNDDEEQSQGQDLAREFYQQVRIREEQQQKSYQQQKSNDIDDMTYSEKEARSLNRDPFLQDSNARDTLSNRKNNVKFTGRKRGELDSSGTPSAGLFAGQNGSVFADASYARSERNRFGNRNGSNSRTGNRVSPREQMMRSEFNLLRVASSEQVILIQVALVLLLLGFTVYVGLTGGITDGSDRFGFDAIGVSDFNGLGENLDFPDVATDNAADAVLPKGSVDSSVWL